ncbi:hypothetical protein ACLK1T_18285 [Escherichia coli]
MGYTAAQGPPVILRTCWKIRAGIPRTLRINRSPPRAALNTAHFQQVTLDLTGLQMASASLLDEATAAAEALASGETRQQTEKCQPLLRGFRRASANAGCGPYSCRNLWF